MRRVECRGRHGITFDNAVYTSLLTITAAGYVDAGTSGAVYVEAPSSLCLLNAGAVRVSDSGSIVATKLQASNAGICPPVPAEAEG